jgi:hypothetical protein
VISLKHWLYLPLLPLLVSCGSGDTSLHESEQELHARAARLKLQDRYDLYLNVYFSRIPRNPILAEDVAQLGEPAWSYVMGKASEGGIGKFGANLMIISAFDRECSRAEQSALQKRAESLSSYPTQRDALISQVRVACKITVPRGVRL